jgi:hypothetical protein
MLGRKVLMGVALGLVGGLVSGCGALTAASVLKQGAMWVGEEVIKKEYKEYKAQRQARKEEEARQRQGQPRETGRGTDSTPAR